MAIAVIRIHSGFDRVPHIVDASDTAKLEWPGVWVRVRGCVAIYHQHEPAGIGNYEVRIGIPLYESRQRLETLADAAADHHAALGRQIIGQQNIEVSFAHGCGEA